MTQGLVLWEIISDYGFVFLSIAGVIVVLAMVYRERFGSQRKNKS